MLSTLLTSSDEQAAYVCGILWEATSDLAVAQKVRADPGFRDDSVANIGKTLWKPISELAVAQKVQTCKLIETSRVSR
jgi:hypothetical protein